MQEEKEILAHLEKTSNDKTQDKENEKKDQRLGEIYEQLQIMNASSSESKARRILFGLGFNKEMQIRPTKYFSGEGQGQGRVSILNLFILPSSFSLSSLFPSFIPLLVPYFLIHFFFYSILLHSPLLPSALTYPVSPYSTVLPPHLFSLALLVL